MHYHVLSTLAFLGLVTMLSGVTQTVSRVVVPVVGLDETRGAEIERALRALESKDEPRDKLLSEVEIDIDKGLVQFALADGQTLHLQQLERTLVNGGVRIQRDKFSPGESRLIIAGEAGEDAIDKLRMALTANLFATAEVRREGEPARFVAHVRPGNLPATLDAADKAVRAAVPELRIADVVWSRAKP